MTPIKRDVALQELVEQLEASQWASGRELLDSQLRHLSRLARHFEAHSPWFARRLRDAGVTQATQLGHRSALHHLPVLTRREMQAAGEAFYCAVPQGHGTVSESRTSGSTGEPVVVRRTGVSRLFSAALAMRELCWHRRDVRGRLCTIRPTTSDYELYESWGPPASVFGPTGPMLALPIAADVTQLAAWISEFQPNMLVAFPSTLGVLAAHFRHRRLTLPGLRDVLTFGETLSASVRAAVEATFGVMVADSYSSQEIGHIAIECPVSGLYHVMSESVIAEVVDEDGRPCLPGQFGRILVTDLHNYATPLVRYAIGDVAEVADPCPCGRGLPAWKRILGRERNFICMPDGSRHWPLTGFPRCREVAPVIQYQVVQHSLTTIEARLVVERPLTAGEEDRLRVLFQQAAGFHFNVRFTYVGGRLTPGRSGKFEEFVCNIAPDAFAGRLEAEQVPV
jgi:phenylacetate-CoA ligase